MSIRRILIIGAAGFVGQHLLPALRQAFPDAELATPAFEITDRDTVWSEIAAAHPDALVHLAAITAPTQARQAPDLAWRVNLLGTLNIARAILGTAPNCSMLFASSAEAYGASFRSCLPLDETAPLAPLNTYGATKAAADLALGAMAEDGLRVIRVRPFNHTGPGQSAAFVVPAFAHQLVRIEAGLQDPIVRVGALEPWRDFLDVRDVCAAYVAILANQNQLGPNQILNIASGQPRRIGDVLRAMLQAAGVKAEVQVEADRLRPTDIPMSSGDATLAGRLLGWSPAIAWEQTLADVLADWRQRI